MKGGKRNGAGRKPCTDKKIAQRITNYLKTKENANKQRKKKLTI